VSRSAPLLRASARRELKLPGARAVSSSKLLRAPPWGARESLAAPSRSSSPTRSPLGALHLPAQSSPRALIEQAPAGPEPRAPTAAHLLTSTSSPRQLRPPACSASCLLESIPPFQGARAVPVHCRESSRAVQGSSARSSSTAPQLAPALTLTAQKLRALAPELGAPDGESLELLASTSRELELGSSHLEALRRALSELSRA